MDVDRSIGDDATRPLQVKSGEVPSTLKPGEIIGQYKIQKLLGRGGMGEVYEVEHQVLHRRYALKLLPPEFVSQPGALDRFRREAQVMANLDHPNIIKVDEFGETGGHYWLRMELAAGISEGSGFGVQDSGQRIVSLQDPADAHGGKVPQETLLAILKQVLTGLDYAHNHGAIHRDLKPSNILLFPQPTTNNQQRTTAKIADFGLVRLVGEEWVRSQATRWMTSQNYSSLAKKIL